MDLCKKCDTKLVEGENWCKSRAVKKHRLCKSCATIVARLKRISDPIHNAKREKYYKEYRNRPESKKRQQENSKRWKENNVEAAKLSEKKKRLKYRYGITLEKYTKIFESQGKACAICGITNPLTGGKFHLDHDHSTGTIRGILCSKCNPALGLFMDDEYILLNAIKYLRGVRGN